MLSSLTFLFLGYGYKSNRAHYKILSLIISSALQCTAHSQRNNREKRWPLFSALLKPLVTSLAWDDCYPPSRGASVFCTVFYGKFFRASLTEPPVIPSENPKVWILLILLWFTVEHAGFCVFHWPWRSVFYMGETRAACTYAILCSCG